MAKDAEQDPTPNPTQRSLQAARGNLRGSGRYRGDQGSPSPAGFQSGSHQAGHGSTRGSTRGCGSPKGDTNTTGGSQGGDRGGREKGKTSRCGKYIPTRPLVVNVDPNESDSALKLESRKEFKQQLPKSFWKQTDHEHMDQEKFNLLKAHSLRSISFPKERCANSKGNKTEDLTGKGGAELDKFGLLPPPDPSVEDRNPKRDKVKKEANDLKGRNNEIIKQNLAQVQDELKEKMQNMVCQATVADTLLITEENAKDLNNPDRQAGDQRQNMSLTNEVKKAMLGNDEDNHLNTSDVNDVKEIVPKDSNNNNMAIWDQKILSY